MADCNEIRQKISLYMDGQLDETDAKAFEQHIAGCSECRNELEQMMYIAELCRDLSDEDLPEGFRQELHEKLLKAAEEHGRKKGIVRYINRYAKVFATAAAAVIIMVTLRMFIGSDGALLENNAAKYSADASPKIAQDAGANQEIALKSIEPDQSVEIDKERSLKSAERSGSTKIPDRGCGSKDTEAGHDEDGGVSGIASTLSEGMGIMGAQSKYASVVLTVDEPEAELANIRELLAKYDAVEAKFTSEDYGEDEEAIDPRNADNEKEAEDTQNIEKMIVTINRECYDVFIEKLSEMYGPEDMTIQSGITAMEFEDGQEELVNNSEYLTLEIIVRNK